MTEMHTRRARTAIRTAALVVGVLLAAQLAGCGGGASSSDAQLAQLRTDVAAARTAAANHDQAAVQAALAALQTKVESLRDDGALTRGSAATLLTEIGQARARVPLDVTAATPAGATGPTMPVTPQAAPPQGPESGPGHDNGNGKDKGKAKGRGNGQGDGGD